MNHAVALTLTLTLGAAAIGCSELTRSPAAGTTTITGAPAGPRVTSSRPERDQLATHLADEVCAREARCGRVGDADGARYRTAEACMLDQGSRTPAQVSRWGCAPEATSAPVEACSEALRQEPCSGPLARLDDLRACSRASVCGSP